MAQDRQTSGNKWLLPAVGLGVVVIAIVLLIALCSGGDDDDSGSDDQGSAPTATADGSGETPGVTDDSGEDASAVLSELSGRWGETAARIVYEFEAGTGDSSETTTLTYYVDPPNSRTDFEVESGETSSFIQTGDNFYLCAAGQCISYPSGGVTNPISLIGDFAEPDSISRAIAGLGGGDVETFEEEIAGVDAKCFKAEYSGSEVSWCFSDDGVLLLSSSRTAGFESTIRATEFSTDVSDADFEPPFDVIELPGT